MALATVTTLIADVRRLLQDTVVPYRYTDANLVTGLNEAMIEARRLRPDLFLGVDFTLPSYTAVDSTAIDVDAQYRMALVYYVVGNAQLSDDEETQDARASAFITKFERQLTGGA